MVNIRSLATRLNAVPSGGPGPCEHRTVSKEGRIVCQKIVQGEAEVTPDLCHACPLHAINCVHLRCSLRQTSPSPLIVRYNGRTEIWDDLPAEIKFQQAACAAKVAPIQDPQQCAGCALRQALQGAERPTVATEQRLLRAGKVVRFPGRPSASAVEQ